MKKRIAEKIMPIVATKTQTDALEAYVEMRFDILKDALVYAENIEEIRRHQGAYQELKRLLTLRDEVLNAKD